MRLTNLTSKITKAIIGMYMQKSSKCDYLLNELIIKITLKKPFWAKDYLWSILLLINLVDTSDMMMDAYLNSFSIALSNSAYNSAGWVFPAFTAFLATSCDISTAFLNTFRLKIISFSLLCKSWKNSSANRRFSRHFSKLLFASDTAFSLAYAL